eukprot:188229_1
MALTLCFITIILPQLSSSQEERIYLCGFDQAQGCIRNWTIDTGSFNPDQHQYDPIEWYNWNGDYSKCPRYNASHPSLSDASCIRLFNDASISRIISTVGYHSIRWEIDLNPQGLEEGEWCFVHYLTAKTNGIKIVNNRYALAFGVSVADTNFIANNESTFEVKLGVSGTTGGASCLFDNLEIFGIPYTISPTQHPTSNPTNPSSSPTISTNNPTLYPTNTPSIFSTLRTRLVTMEVSVKSERNVIQILCIVLGICLFCFSIVCILACRERKRKQKKHIIENPACACNTSLAMSSNAPGLFVMGSMRPEGQPREADGLINQNNVPKNTDNDPKTQMEMITIITPDGDKQELISNVNIADT